MKPQVLYEDNHIIIVNKRCGDIVQGDKTGDTTLAEQVKAYIKQKYNKPGEVFLGIAHRLDRPTSGIVIFARTSKALPRLNKMFLEREIEKKYWAVVCSKPKQKEGTLTHFLLRNRKQNKSYATLNEKKESKKASLSYRLKAQSEGYYLLEINLHTGRHHQIRAQLAAEKLTIKGDLKYGASRSNPNAGIHLHAYSVKFTHPVSKKEIAIIAPPPNEVLWNFFKSL